MSLYIQTTIIVIVGSVISKEITIIVIVGNARSKQITIKKKGQRKRNKTVQWQTTIKDKKIQTFQ